MDATVAEVMSTDLVVAARTTRYRELIRRMRERGVNALPVVGPGHRLVGVVALSGKVEWRSLAREIVALTHDVRGVVGVVDRLGCYGDGTVPTWSSRARS
jgi:CBS-domain-containing membrane protein